MPGDPERNRTQSKPGGSQLQGSSRSSSSPIYERRISPDAQALIGAEILKRIGDASQPHDPELLRR